MEKVKFELEVPIHASPNMLYQYVSSPSNLQEWFADKVNSRGKIFSFVWEDSEELAELVTKKSGERIRWKWVESEDDESYFEIKIQVDPLTKDVSLIVTDFADDEDEVEEAKQLWENQIEELKHTIGA
ncbi:SRPBCC domain-containing protein [Polaribacter aestuariivivens]|uniref:SRPBCC domain-containing protein n=1 Tax=Polaribacter aestuariivivens TaxID=2304626 RepID=A0A5S3N0K4_9FLAO|nr:START-like domain-containing protein [Polaribacter aestuariivivens]TMM28745.1 SRPBCC domain-containing protein [Polaribacter aestuariivivens]